MIGYVARRVGTWAVLVFVAVNLTEAVLTYDVARFSCLEGASSVPVAVTGPQLEWTWVMTRSGNPPPGTAVTWHWTLTDDSGNLVRLASPAKRIGNGAVP